MSNHEEILNYVLEKICPTKAQKSKLQKFVRKLTQQLQSIVPGNVLLKHVGSTARDTWIVGDIDIDIFLLFPKETEIKTLRHLGIKIGKELFKRFNAKYEIDYAEHPYVKGKLGKYKVEIVPCFNLPNCSKIKSAVDRTIFHQKFMEQTLKMEKNLALEIRFLKQFCKGIGIYGSDHKVCGFSGYLCELLVLKYKSFLNVLQAANMWGNNEIISLETEKKIKTKDPLVFVDPVDPNRNVASALSRENYELFKIAAKAFMKNPQITFFFRREPLIDKNMIKNCLGQHHYFFLFFSTGKINAEILWSQMRKASRRISNKLDSLGFHVEKSYVWSDEEKLGVFIFKIKNPQLDNFEKRTGPPLNAHEKFLASFLDKHKERKIYLANNRLYTYIERRFSSVEQFFNYLASLSQKQLCEIGIPRKLSNFFPYKLIKGNSLFQSKNKEFISKKFMIYLMEILSEKKPWES